MGVVSAIVGQEEILAYWWKWKIICSSLLAGTEYGAYWDTASDPGHSPTLKSQHLVSERQAKRTRTCRISIRVSRALTITLTTHANDLLIHFLEVAMNLWSVDGQTTERLGLVTWQNDWGIGEALCFRDKVDLDLSPSYFQDLGTYDVHTETVSALVEPPVHHVKDSFSELWILPVQV